MHIKSLLAVALLSAPAITLAAPVANERGVSATNDVFVRYKKTCNPQFSTDPQIRAKQGESEKRMTALSVEYRAAEKKCPSNASTTFSKKGGDKRAKEALKKKCIDGYKECAEKRELANKACVAAGGKTDAGHKDAVKFCKDKAADWRKKKVQ